MDKFYTKTACPGLRQSDSPLFFWTIIFLLYMGCSIGVTSPLCKHYGACNGGLVSVAIHSGQFCLWRHVGYNGSTVHDCDRDNAYKAFNCPLQQKTADAHLVFWVSFVRVGLPVSCMLNTGAVRLFHFDICLTACPSHWNRHNCTVQLLGIQDT